MVVSNLLLWKRDAFSMCLCGRGRDVCGMRDTGFPGEGPNSGVFFRQLEVALEFCPERTDLGPLSILLGVASGSLVWRTVQWGHLLPSPSRTVLPEAR